MMDTWTKQEVLKAALGTEELLEELCRSLGTWAMEEHLSFIAQNHGVEFEEEKEED